MCGRLKLGRAALFWLSLAACGDDGSSEPSDASLRDAAAADASSDDGGEASDASTSGPRVQVGTGQDAFESLSDGDPVAFFLGPQTSGDPLGGYHVWGAVRGEGLNPAGAAVGFELLDRSSSEVLGASATRRINLVSDGAGGQVAYGFPTILADCCAVRGRALRFRVQVVDGDQRSFSDELDVVGASDCLDLERQSVCR